MRLYSPQALAFLGDAVYELLVRERIVLKANRPVSELHLQAVEQVRASYQSQAYAVIEPLLTEEEAAALKRGRNLNSVKPPKNGNVRDYRRATGLESLFGYLYVQGRLERINELGTTVLVVTHAKELVNRFSKRVVAIENGRIISDETGGYYNNETTI